jgi:regulator of sirC expression with transglutaminase-like and TPR domain
MPTDNPVQHLQSINSIPEEEICLAGIALALSNRGVKTIPFYVDHLRSLAQAVRLKHDGHLQHSVDSAALQLKSLRAVVIDEYGYTGNLDDYDALENADLGAVIDNRKGMPITLSIIFLDIAGQLGWDISGVAMPGHFLCRIDFASEQTYFDPFKKAKVVTAPELRALTKQALGPNAELKPEHYQVANRRMILLRLQNNIKLRQIQSKDYLAAIDTLTGMQKIAPDESAFLFEAAQLHAAVGQSKKAIELLNTYLAHAPSHYDRGSAAALLQKLEKTLH